MMGHCWASVCDAGPTMPHHWVDYLCFFGVGRQSSSRRLQIAPTPGFSSLTRSQSPHPGTTERREWAPIPQLQKRQSGVCWVIWPSFCGTRSDSVDWGLDLLMWLCGAVTVVAGAPAPPRGARPHRLGVWGLAGQTGPPTDWCHLLQGVALSDKVQCI